MAQERIDRDMTDSEIIAGEGGIREKVDDDGIKWKKVYFGGGAHFRNWLSQIMELLGEENIEVEGIDSAGLQCYEESGEKLYRIWVREGALEQKKKSL